MPNIGYRSIGVIGERLYKKARKGEIKGFTGIDSPYEAPLQPALEIKTDELSLEESVDEIYNFIIKQVKI